MNQPVVVRSRPRRASRAQVSKRAGHAPKGAVRTTRLDGDQMPIPCRQGRWDLEKSQKSAIFPLCVRKLQKGVDPTQTRPYMPSHRGGADGFNRLTDPVANTERTASPPNQNSGNGNCPLNPVGGFFDIVDFDEGTCGRRRLVPGVLRLRIPV